MNFSYIWNIKILSYIIFSEVIMDKQKLLSSDLNSLSKNELFSLMKLISRLIGSSSHQDKLKLIQKNREISELIKLKFPKNKNAYLQAKRKLQKKQNRVILNCKSCSNDFDTSIKNKNMFAFCKDCRKKRDRDLVELLTSEGTIIYKDSEIEKAEKALSKLEANVRLDFHGVLDLLTLNDKVGESSMVLSYVGKLTRTRTNTKTDILNRMKSKQVKFGILVFKRGKNGTGEENKFHVPGSKAWVNKLVKFESESLFIDDSLDHFNSVKSLNLSDLKVIHLKKGSTGDDLLKILEK